MCKRVRACIGHAGVTPTFNPEAADWHHDKKRHITSLHGRTRHINGTFCGLCISAPKRTIATISPSQAQLPTLATRAPPASKSRGGVRHESTGALTKQSRVSECASAAACVRAWRTCGHGSVVAPTRARGGEEEKEEHCDRDEG